jgi:sulfur transfer protein SufE
VNAGCSFRYCSDELHAFRNSRSPAFYIYTQVAKELAEARKKKEKKVTKAAQAKKLLNKGIANPQKVKFDEETGAPLVDGAVAMATEAVEEDSDGEGMAVLCCHSAWSLAS